MKQINDRKSLLFREPKKGKNFFFFSNSLFFPEPIFTSPIFYFWFLNTFHLTEIHKKFPYFPIFPLSWRNLKFSPIFTKIRAKIHTKIYFLAQKPVLVPKKVMPVFWLLNFSFQCTTQKINFEINFLIKNGVDFFQVAFGRIKKIEMLTFIVRTMKNRCIRNTRIVKK